MNISLTTDQQKRLTNNPCTECNNIAEVRNEYENPSFTRLVYIAYCNCQETRACLEIDTAIDEWILNN